MITNNGLKYLSGVHFLGINSMKDISDDGLAYLSHIKKLYIGWNKNITAKGLQYLTGIQYLNIIPQFQFGIAFDHQAVRDILPHTIVIFNVFGNVMSPIV